jgi:type II secretory pathway predicted ATPase ExeA
MKAVSPSPESAKPVSDMQSRFGFYALPFTREIAVKDRFVHPLFDAALKGLHEAISQKMSAALIAPAGFGKTAALRALDELLPAARYQTRYIDVTALNKREFCREVATAIGAKLAGNYPALVHSLKERFLSTIEVDGLRPVLLVDNSHEFRPDVLSIIRVLTNFSMDSKLVVSIILAGQLPLVQLLRRLDLEDVQGRLAHIAYLSALSRTETMRYIEHRCHIVGSKTNPFDNDSIDAIYEISRGNMRAIDRLCLKALSLAHEQNVMRVDSNHITEARKLLWP